MKVTTTETLVSLAQSLTAMTDREAEVIAIALDASYALSHPGVALWRWRRRCIAAGLPTWSIAQLRDAVRTVGSLDAIRAAYRPVPVGKADGEVERLERITGIPTPGGSSRAGTGPIGDKGSTALPGRNDSPGGNSAPVGQDAAVKRKRRRRRR